MSLPTLPTARPTSTTYGGDLINDRPVAFTDRELDATYWNQAKADLVQLGSVSALARARIDNSGAASVLRTYGIDPSLVTATRISTGVVDVKFSGLTILDGEACACTSGAGSAACTNNGTDTLRVCTSLAGVATDLPFLVSAF